eukprot:TRINITY_DN5981_c0_g1_i5.p1 TRINITY_DN5981_c0_g1~~TRINITY_DN5981_c0_g1_i5.p1  ORF type:complete len:608 (-),score=54.48 TRINITY_DN5981_c0_g1_i5:257-2080(-)
MWPNVNGGSGGYDSHGRRKSGGDDGQWMQGDVVTTSSSCPKMVPAYEIQMVATSSGGRTYLSHDGESLVDLWSSSGLRQHWYVTHVHGHEYTIQAIGTNSGIRTFLSHNGHHDVDLWGNQARSTPTCSLSGLSASSRSGRQIQVIDRVPLEGDSVFTDRDFGFISLGRFEDMDVYFIKVPNDDMDTNPNDVMWTLNSPVGVTVYLDLWVGDTFVTNGLKAWLSTWTRTSMQGSSFGATHGPGIVYKKSFPAGLIEIRGNGGEGDGVFYLFVESACNQRWRIVNMHDDVFSIQAVAATSGGRTYLSHDGDHTVDLWSELGINQKWHIPGLSQEKGTCGDANGAADGTTPVNCPDEYVMIKSNASATCAGAICVTSDVGSTDTSTCCEPSTKDNQDFSTTSNLTLVDLAVPISASSTIATFALTSSTSATSGATFASQATTTQVVQEPGGATASGASSTSSSTSTSMIYLSSSMASKAGSTFGGTTFDSQATTTQAVQEPGGATASGASSTSSSTSTSMIYLSSSMASKAGSTSGGTTFATQATTTQAVQGPGDTTMITEAQIAPPPQTSAKIADKLDSESSRAQRLQVPTMAAVSMAALALSLMSSTK